MNWLKKIANYTQIGQSNRTAVPGGLWSSCPECGAMLYREELEINLHVCLKCGHHLPITARARLQSFLDPKSFVELGTKLRSGDALKFKDLKKYSQRLSEAENRSGENESLIAGEGMLIGEPVSVAAFDFRFMGGSMGSVAGERFLMAAEKSLEEKKPLISFAASGGARMQESLFSLMQMARTSAVTAKLREEGIAFISILTHPTYGGVSASLAMLGDINIAEPGALIGFAGPRVIEQTVREKLPEGFQKSQFLLEHGAIDAIIERQKLRHEVANLLRVLMHKEPAVSPK